MSQIFTTEAQVQAIIHSIISGQRNASGGLVGLDALGKIPAQYINPASDYRGTASPSDNPGSPTTEVYYIATTTGTYTNFGGLAVTASDGLNILSFVPGIGWSKAVIPVEFNPEDYLSLIGDYTNILSTGDRRNRIFAEASLGLISGGSVSNLLDGVTNVNNNTNASSFTAISVDNSAFFTFDFYFLVILRGFRWIQSGTQSHGTWKLQGSNDNVNYSDIGNSFTLGGSRSSTYVFSNQSYYRYYKIVGVTGTTSDSPYINEIEFSIIQKNILDTSIFSQKEADFTTISKLTSEYYFNEGSGNIVLDKKSKNNLTSLNNLKWTSKGVILQNNILKTPSISGIRTRVILYKTTRNEVGKFITSGGPTGPGSGIFSDSISNPYFYKTLSGSGIKDLLFLASNGTSALELNRGGWILVFEEFNSTYSGVHGIGGRHSDNTFLCSNLEVAYFGLFSDVLTDSEREIISSRVASLVKPRGVLFRNQDCDKKIDAVLLLGQSNADGRADISTIPSGNYNFGNIYINSLSSNNKLLIYPNKRKLLLGVNQQRSNPSSQFGPEIGAALNFDRDVKRGVDLVVVKCAVGSTFLESSVNNGGLEHWNSDELVPSGLLYTAIFQWFDVLQNLMLEGYSVDLKSIWWMQGEQDATNLTASTNYLNNLQNLFDKIKLTTGFSNVRMEVARIRDQDPLFDPTAVINVRTAQSQFVTNNSSAASLINTDDLALKPDLVHYNSPAMITLGQRFYNATYPA